MTMKKRNSVFIATSLDGFIADKNGGIEWLHADPAIENIDMGYDAFMANIDALVMGRMTFETVCGFNIPWPYTKPVFVLSNTLNQIPDKFSSNATLVHGTIPAVLEQLHQQGYHRLYIDGGKTIQGFLNEDLIDDMVITTIPVLLGEGIPLFATVPSTRQFACVESKRYADKVVQNRFVRLR